MRRLNACGRAVDVTISTHRYLEPRPAIVYVHGAGSSRAEAADAPLSVACAIGASLLAVDTTAQGRSDGDVGSLGGDYEIADVAACVDWLRREAKIDHILLWGRSAGAVACLGYAREAEMNDAPVRGVVADSAFSNLREACEGLFERRAPALPRAFRRRVLDAAFVEVKRVAGWDPRERRVDEVCKKLAMTPVLFAGAREDDLVPIKHAETLHAATRRGELVLFPGTHNSPRPVQVLNSFRSFARRRLMDGSAFARRAFGDIANLRIATYSPATRFTSTNAASSTRLLNARGSAGALLSNSPSQASLKFANAESATTPRTGVSFNSASRAYPKQATAPADRPQRRMCSIFASLRSQSTHAATSAIS